jgi:predicted esterase
MKTILKALLVATILTAIYGEGNLLKSKLIKNLNFELTTSDKPIVRHLQ